MASTDDLSKYFQEWQKGQQELVKKSHKKLKKKRQRQNKKNNSKNKTNDVKQQTKVEALSDEFLEDLVANEGSPKTKRKPTNTSGKIQKKKLKLTSSLIDNADYIPLDANVTSTDFKIVRLDKHNSADQATQNATEFYNRRLYGKHVHREPTKLLFAGIEKLKAKRALCVK